jgi:hypothetical protein
MSLDASKVRMQDIRNLFRFYTATPLGRLVTLHFLLTNWDEINSRYGESGIDVLQIAFVGETR